MPAMNWPRRTILTRIALGAAIGCLVSTQLVMGRRVRAHATSRDTDWSTYNGGVAGDHYSPLAQINRENVGDLKLAWTYDTGERGGLEVNPLVIGRTMFVYTPSQKIVALEAASGKVIWTFDSGITT
jgi:quinoprotein glucose dehydrogenase